MTPKFVAMAVSPSFLFALGEDGKVYQMVEETVQSQWSLLVTFSKRRYWKVAEDCEWVNQEWR